MQLTSVKVSGKVQKYGERDDEDVCAAKKPTKEYVRERIDSQPSIRARPPLAARDSVPNANAPSLNSSFFSTL